MGLAIVRRMVDATGDCDGVTHTQTFLNYFKELQVQTTHNINTKVDDKAVAKATVLTIDWGNTSAEVVNGPVGRLAAQQYIVHVQQSFRKHGIPGKFTGKIMDYKNGGRIALTSEQMIEILVEGAKNDPKARAELQARLKASGFSV